MPAIPLQELQAPSAGESSNAIRIRVEAARDRMCQRQGKPNALLSPSEVEKYYLVDDEVISMFSQAISKLCLSARSFHGVLKVARTIADLAASDRIGVTHFAEAIAYRRALDTR